MRKKRLLFIPVSSPKGIGEYIRSLGLAEALADMFPERIECHFILNKYAAYAEHCPFPTTLLEKSATKESSRVSQVIADYRPDLVIFDCSGRASHMRKAKQCGAKVVFISQHVKKRSKGFKLNRLGLIDRHWVVQPDFSIDALSLFEKLKCKYFQFAEPVNVGPFFSKPDNEETNKYLGQHGLIDKEYFVVNAGSGGHQKDGKLYADEFYLAAQAVQEKLGKQGVVVFGSNYPKTLPENDFLIVLSNQPAQSFLALLSSATFAILSAGDTLLQAIELQIPCVAAPVSSDQPQRLAKCESKELAIASKATSFELVKAVEQLLSPANFKKIEDNIMALPAFDAKSGMIADIQTLVFGGN